MAKTFARLVEHGEMDFEDVPDNLKDKVKDILIKDGFYPQD